MLLSPLAAQAHTGSIEFAVRCSQFLGSERSVLTLPGPDRIEATADRQPELGGLGKRSRHGEPRCGRMLLQFLIDRSRE